VLDGHLDRAALVSAFDSLWDAAAAKMDAAVDSMLGDALQVRLAGAPAFVAMQGFVVDDSEPQAFDTALDETLGTRKRVKIAKALMPVPSRNHRIQHPRLGPGTFAPAGSDPQSQGRYWIFDVQKVTA
jgi:hypothetical protein